MKNILAIILIAFTIGLSAQDYIEHTVKPGETIESIAKGYLVTPFDIYALNPDARRKFQPNTVLIIPNSKVKNESIIEDSRELIGYKNHKVKRKETLYGLAQEYSVSEEEIKKANRSLYSENLKKGDKIRIPRFKTVVSKQTLTNTVKKYTVLPQEGKWRIAYKFGISVADLEALNPFMNETIQPGDELNVPNIKDKEEKQVESTFGYYEVLPKEGFFRLKVKLNLTQEELEQLNPELKETGLKAGMILKVPEGVDTKSQLEAVEITNLKSGLTNFKTKKIALMMPYRLDRIDVDAVEETKEKIKETRLLSTVLDFHVGVMMALDSAKQLGISTDLKVFDTRYHVSKTAEVLAENDFSDYDAVIGPMEENSFNRVAMTLKADNIPVIAAMNKPKQVYNNVFQTIPDDKLLSKTMIDFVKADSLKTKVVIISDHAHKTSSEALQKVFPNSKLILTQKDKKDKTKDAYYIYHANLQNVFSAGRTIVFLETDNSSLASSVISMLNAFAVDKTEIILATLNKGKAFEGKDIDNNNLSHLKFHYPSVHKDFDETKSNGFVEAYRKEYGVTPSKYVARGFDITLDLLMRLASAENLYDASINSIETEYIENKFRYNKALSGGYINEAVYIVKYDDLRIVKAE
ncbi:amino acid ABC transporter substrate-binding protein [Winogradskyella thalassocola]|uniref:ABC-type branched-chain amino acid transport system, substrate-binding protein n=1 Tax=Winogradskyella thalassocola TaxID=262004 RepID=A0A1G8HA55_9FLAO|nr:LysM peptidoglycan-binding domain-containing protein [Winogradskyella thalassocola]SDI03381.1 ABC-type branched-chain amino acid transport system, substrate-binding protein [Winogradskyella thalassocola]